MTQCASDSLLLEIRKAYFASISSVDFEIGRVLDSLNELGLERETVVAFVSDHGLHIGENGLYGKHDLYENVLHVPMMIRIPGEPIMPTDYWLCHVL